MATTPDRFPGTREEDELKLTPESSDPTSVGAMRLVSGDFRLRDNYGVFNPRAFPGTLGHSNVRDLIHFIDEGPACGFASGAFKEVIGGTFPTQIIWWESAAKLKKIVEKNITRSGGGATNTTPTPIEWKMYDTDGVTVKCTVTDAITYSGAFEVSRTRTIA